MPSLLSPISQPSRSYTPLSDEVNPPFSTAAPAPMSSLNGVVVYPKRVTSSSSSTSTDTSERERDPDRLGVQLRSESEETLSPGTNHKGKEPILNGHRTALGFEEADLGEMRRVGTKGKEKQWDLERGDAVGGDGFDRYPPLNETEEEERRIQENLARFAARDMARRRASRVNRQLPSSPNPGRPAFSSTTSGLLRRPLSVLSSISSGTEGKGSSSIFGLMDGIMGSPKGKGAPWTDGELPLATSPRNSQHPDTSAEPYTNPYDLPHNSPPARKMTISSVSPHQHSPFADPATADKQSPRRASLASASSDTSAPQTPTEANGFGYGYVGPSWRGGAAAGQGIVRSEGGEKWWHALCAWNSDMDDDGDNERGGQAGRTNPFE